MKSRIAVLVCGICLPASVASLYGEKFYSDDPVWKTPRQVQVGDLPYRDIGGIYDFVKQSFSPTDPVSGAARGTNTIGEVPDNDWFTNRHGLHRMTREELQRGPGTSAAPVSPFRVVGAKTDGITPGFTMKDANGTRFFVKPDPRTNPEMATGADVMGARFFHAIGYYTPQNYLVLVARSELQVAPESKVKGAGNRPRPMIERDLDDILRIVPRGKDGRYRIIASRAVDGRAIGPFRYEGTRSDDPNDVVPHEDRRDLRGLAIFCAWLNHTDAKAKNSMDTVVAEEDGRKFVRHYLIDFGSAFGSDADMPKNVRFGNEYIIPQPGDALKGMLFGLNVKPWESANYGKVKAAGRIESEAFNPDRWTSNYPNPAFLRRLPDDEYWAAKIVLAFTDDDIRAIVETAQFSDPAATEYVARTIAKRRDKIGRTYLAKVLPLENFAVVEGKLRFENLAVRYGYTPAPEYRISWFRFDNTKGEASELKGESSAALPAEALSARDGSYYGARITATADPQKAVTAYLRRAAGGWTVAGVERSWREVVAGGR